MVDCCPQQTPMYHNGHTYTQQQAIALQQYYQQQQQQHYHNNYSPSSSSSSSSSHGYPSPPDQDYQRRLNAYCGFNNDPLNRNNGYVPPYNNYQLDNNRVYDQSRYQQQHMHHHMYRQHGHAYYHGHDTQLTSSSNPVRESRNRAEKNRRDKMLRSVHELGRIVPLVSLASAANKRTDRTGILRLTASFIRIETQLKPGLLKLLQPNIKSFDWEKFLLESLESVLLVVSGSGKIVFVSNTVKDLLGHDPLDMLGRQLTDYTQKNDCDELNKQLKINPDENTSGYTAAGSAMIHFLIAVFLNYRNSGPL